jgi:hypothetical protein
VDLYFKNYVAEVCGFKNILCFLASGQGYMEEGKGYASESPFRRGTPSSHLLNAYDFITQLLESHIDIQKRPKKSFYSFICCGLESGDIFRRASSYIVSIV